TLGITPGFRTSRRPISRKPVADRDAASIPMHARWDGYQRPGQASPSNTPLMTHAPPGLLRSALEILGEPEPSIGALADRHRGFADGLAKCPALGSSRWLRDALVLLPQNGFSDHCPRDSGMISILQLGYTPEPISDEKSQQLHSAVGIQHFSVFPGITLRIR